MHSGNPGFRRTSAIAPRPLWRYRRPPETAQPSLPPPPRACAQTQVPRQGDRPPKQRYRCAVDKLGLEATSSSRDSEPKAPPHFDLLDCARMRPVRRRPFGFCMLLYEQ